MTSASCCWRSSTSSATASRFAAFGLTDEQARLTPTAGTLSVGGLVTHVTAMERGWIDLILQRAGGGPVDGDAEATTRPASASRPTATLADALAELRRRGRRDGRGRPPDAPRRTPCRCPRACRGTPTTSTPGRVRWVLLHLVEEIGRHAGHADIVRESIDGATMYELMAAAEGWPATEWLQPWSAPEPV